MIVASQFEGDTNKVLQDAQHESYWENIGLVFLVCAEKMIEASELIQIDAEIATQLRRIESFDHRVLQDTHDIIAAYYRYINSDFPQLPLPLIERTKQRYTLEWSSWLRDELKELSRSPYFVRGVVNAVLFANNQMGYMSENQIGSYLVSRYRMRTWARADWYVKVYITPM